MGFFIVLAGACSGPHLVQLRGKTLPSGLVLTTRAPPAPRHPGTAVTARHLAADLPLEHGDLLGLGPAWPPQEGPWSCTRARQARALALQKMCVCVHVCCAHHACMGMCVRRGWVCACVREGG